MPPIELSPEDRADMTPEEIEALTGVDAEANLAAAGTTPAAKEDPAEETAATSTEDAKPAEAASTAAPTAADELAELLDETTASQQAPIKTEGPADYKAEKQALKAQRADVEAKWGAGELTDAERAEQLEKISDAIEELTIAHTRATTIQQINAHNAQQEMDAAVQAVLALATATKTIDYKADPKAAKQFDSFLRELLADTDNAGKPPAELTREAHRSVLAMRGIAEKPAATGETRAATQQQAAPAARQVPPSIADMPNAAPKGLEVEALAKFATLEGDEAEEYLASLPPGEQERILRAADEQSMRHSHDSRGARRSRTAA